MLDLLLTIDVSGLEWLSWGLQKWDILSFADKIRILGVGISVVLTFMFGMIRMYLAFKRKMALKIVDPEQLWMQRASQLQEDIYQHGMSRKRIPVLTIANFKGGSGKTMLAANLAACFDSIGAKVLLVDFDGHGSLSALVGDEDNPQAGRASSLLEREVVFDDIKPRKIKPYDERGRGFQHTYICRAGKDLTHSENALLLKWITGRNIKRKKDDKAGFFYRLKGWLNFSKRIKNFFWRWAFRGQLDIRFNTFNYLRSRAVQEKFDLVIIDTPSQLTPAFVNALCATTHLLIPTTADKLSMETTVQSTDLFQKMKSALRLQFRTLSIIPTMTQRGDRLVARERRVLKTLAHDMNPQLRNSIINDDVKRLPKGERQQYLNDLSATEDEFKGVIWEDKKVPSRKAILDDEGNLAFFHQQPAENQRFREIFGHLGGWLIEEFECEGTKNEELAAKLKASELKRQNDIPSQQPSENRENETDSSTNPPPIFQPAEEELPEVRTG